VHTVLFFCFSIYFILLTTQNRLGRYGGVWPISQAGAPIATVTIAGFAFDLYFGYNGDMKVYSFLTTTPNTPYTNFTADVKLFFDYLTKEQSYPASTQNLIGEFHVRRRWW
jgi:xyloglucan-specific endo-beta-1,4-glucanase